MAIQPEQALKLKEEKLKKEHNNTIAAIEAGIDDQIRKWDGVNEVKYHTGFEICPYITNQLTSRFYGWNILFQINEEGNKYTGWITLTPKRETPNVPWVPNDDWGGPYKKKVNPYDPWDVFSKVNWGDGFPFNPHTGAKW